MSSIKISAIGEITHSEDGFAICIRRQYRDGLIALEGFSHIYIIWWANKFEESMHRKTTLIEMPYKKGPDKIGVFATRSPVRPNPIAINLSIVELF
jgi:tRNA (adenine37-N6)-methyltransferase